MKMKWMLFAATMLSTAAIAGAATQFNKQVPVGPQDRVNVSNIAGSVSITTWEGREIDVQGELGSGVDRVEVRQDTGNVDIKVIVKDGDWWNGQSSRDGEARLQIRMPAGVQLDVNTVSAPIIVSGVRGRMRLKSVSGDIRSSIMGTDLDAKTVSGNVQLMGSNPQANVRASSVSGNVDLIQVGGDVDARSTSGDVDIDSKGSSELRAHSVSGDIGVRGVLASDADLDLQSVSGRVKVAAQAPGGYKYDLSSFSGSIRNCFGYAVERNDIPGNSHLNGVRGEGKGNVRMKSHSGTVDLCDH
jgi:Putative adhesin